MLEFIKSWAPLLSERRAVTPLEYVLIAGTIVAVVVLGFGKLGPALSDKFSSIGQSF